MISATFSYVTLPYKTSVPVRERALSENRFLKVTLLEKDYYLSVLPHFHEMALEEVHFKLEHFFLNYSLNFDHVSLEQRFFNLASEDTFLKSFNGEMLFHLESLLLGILRKTHLDLFLSNEVKINSLYRQNYPIEHYKESQCIKIKITPQSEKKTVEIIKKLHQQNAEMLFRLDGNRRFELIDLLIFDQFLKKNLPQSAYKKIDYLEEPLKNFYESALFEQKSELTIAADESFIPMAENNLFKKVSVIKPSLHGLSPIFSLLRFCQDKRFIISSSFEHPTISVSLFELAKLRPKEFHGLESFSQYLTDFIQ